MFSNRCTKEVELIYIDNKLKIKTQFLFQIYITITLQ